MSARMLLARRAGRSAGGTSPRWLIGITLSASLLFGAAIGAGSGLATLAVGASAIPLLLAISIPWLAALSVLSALVFRLAAPAASGPAALVPDILVVAVCGRVLADLALGQGRPLPHGMRRILWPLAGFVGLTLISTVVSGDSLAVWAHAMRQFLRYPVWALALSRTNLEARDAKRLVVALLAVSLVQFPLALFQFVHPVASTVLHGVRFYKGDNVSGTFGFGGSSTAMVFLVICSAIWLSLVFTRVVPAWLLWCLAPLLVLPMALGSAVSYVFFLPLAILVLLFQGVVSRRIRLSAAGMTGGAFLLIISIWAAGHFALAPGFAGSKQQSGTVLFSESYLARYFSETGTSTQPGSRLGFLRFAVGSDLRAGWVGEALGHGPSLAVLDQSGPSKLQGELGNHAALATMSVQSLQRLVIGFGFIVPGLFLLILLLPPIGLRHALPADPFGRGLFSALPVAGVICAVASVYNAPWSDPGVSAAFWTLVVAGYAGAWDRSDEPGHAAASDDRAGDLGEGGSSLVSSARGQPR
jgi:hypothetical protein